MIKCIKFLFCIIIIATSCSDSAFEEEQSEAQNNLDVKTELRLPCSQIDYVTVGVFVQGTLEDACQNAICAAWYDLANYYETYTVTRRIQREKFTGDLGEDGTQEPTVTTTTQTITKLTNESLNNYESYLTTLEDNIMSDPDNAEYWETFIYCYKNIIEG